WSRRSPAAFRIGRVWRSASPARGCSPRERRTSRRSWRSRPRGRECNPRMSHTGSRYDWRARVAPMTAARLAPRGLAAATAAFSIWGLFPVYLHPLSGVPALQVIAHRVSWACVVLFGWLLLRGELATVSATLTNGRLLARLTLTALLISANWLVYVWSVTHA